MPAYERMWRKGWLASVAEVRREAAATRPSTGGLKLVPVVAKIDLDATVPESVADPLEIVVGLDVPPCANVVMNSSLGTAAIARTSELGMASHAV
jgi:hypothetical protein